MTSVPPTQPPAADETDVPCANCRDAHPVDVSCSANERDLRANETASERAHRVVYESEARLCECDRLDQRSNPHRHDRDEGCSAWAVLGETVVTLIRQRDAAYAELDQEPRPAGQITGDEWALIADALDRDRVRRYYDPDGLLAQALERIVAERVRVVEGERDALRIDLATCERIANGIEDRAESAEAAHEEAEQHIVQLTESRDRAEHAHEQLQAAVEALAGCWEAEARRLGRSLSELMLREAAADLRALLAGGEER